RAHARGAQLVLPARGPAGSLRPAERSEATRAQSPTGCVVVRAGRRARCAGRIVQLPRARPPARHWRARRMNPASSTLYTAPPGWHWLIVLYFFLGGLAGGAYFLAALMDLRGSPGDRPVARLGYLWAFPLTVICGILLTLDLGRPLRFWHRLTQSAPAAPMLKTYSPMSIGAWALLIFGAVTFLSFLATLADRAPSFRWAGRIRPPGLLGAVIVTIGAIIGL